MNWSNLKCYSEIQQKSQKKIPSKTLVVSRHNNIAYVCTNSLPTARNMGGEGSAGWALGGRKSTTTVPPVFLKTYVSVLVSVFHSFSQSPIM
jgi:hypothetical protein